MVQIISILLLVIGISIAVPSIAKLITGVKYRRILWIMFCVYAIGSMYCTTFSRVFGSGVTVELRPFMSIARLFDEPIEGGGKVVGFFAWFMSGAAPFTGIVLNILLFYPLGYLLPYLFPKLKPKHVILIGCLCSIATEATQYLLKMGWCETDDVIHNTLGTALGVWVWHLQSKRLNKPKTNELPKE